jgi:quinol monooxygenase YgiN
MSNTLVTGILRIRGGHEARWYGSGESGVVVFSILKMFPSAKQRVEMVEILRSVQDLTRPAPGCQGCWLCEDDLLHDHVRYVEQWESEDALTEHIRSDLYRRVLAAMELSKQRPEVSFYYTTEKKGFEVIEAARRRTTDSK